MSRAKEKKEAGDSYTENSGQFGWMKLDNAAKIYPPVTRGELTNVFRITAVLNTPVNYSALDSAVTETAKLFPLFSVELCKGFFWYYLEYNGLPPRIHHDKGIPCRAFPTTRGEVMYRILVHDNTISAEFLHILTDGGGAMLYFKTLINNYHIIKNSTSESLFTEKSIDKAMVITEDLFRKYSRKRFPHPERLSKAWHIKTDKQKKAVFHTFTLTLLSDSLTEAAKSHKASVTEYLTAVYLFSIQKLRSRKKRGSKILRVQVPVDLRRKYNEKTTRNFSAFVLPELDLRLGEYDFNEIVFEMRYALGLMASEKRLLKTISRNVSSENNALIRVTPLALKNIVLRIAHNRLGIRQFSGIITNLGKIDISETGSDVLNQIYIIPPPPHSKIKVSCGVTSLGKNTIITFGSVTDDNSLQQEFVRFLTSEGIYVKLAEIRGDKNGDMQ